MEARFRSWWRKRRKLLLVTGIIALLVVAIVLIWASYANKWGGAGFVNKTLWDWLQLLIIPFALAIIAVLFNRAERKNEQRVASDNQQEAALQGYINEISELLLEKDLRKSDVDAEVRTIARVRTLTVLPRLDGRRKRSVLQFLHEPGLIIKDQAVIDLHGADFEKAELTGARLEEASLKGANLSHTDLQWSDLRRADLSRANLRKASLWVADLSEANLSHTDLREADLNGAILIGTNLSDTRLGKADLSGSLLEGANLHFANLHFANLYNADLSDANLKAVQDITIEELEKKARSLKGATMPDGLMHS
jgi:uncharacterized protein YjbI with pentapeptide repeats